MDSKATKDKEILILYLEELIETEEDLLEVCDNYLKL